MHCLSHTCAESLQALVGERLRDAYRSGSSKKQRAVVVAPLWEEARVSLVGSPHPASSSSSNGLDAAAGADHSITSADVDQAMKASSGFTALRV